MKNLLKTLALALPVAMLAACGGGDDNALGTADPNVRFVHAVPAGPNVSLFRFADQPQSDATDVGYKYKSDYYDIETGPATWTLKTATGGIELGTLPSFDYARGNRYTITAVASATGADLVLIDDPFNRAPSSDTARVRVLNGALNSQNVDVYLTAPGTDLATVAPTFPSVAFKSAVPASGNDATNVDGSLTPYQVRVTLAGTKTVIFNSTLTIKDDEDWLLITVPNGVTADAVHVLAVIGGTDPTRTAIELTPQ